MINADADEFFWPVSSSVSLTDVLGAVDPSFGVVEMRRDNLVRDTASLSPRGTRIGPKTCHRGDPEVTVEQGNHGVTGPRLGPMTTTGLGTRLRNGTLHQTYPDRQPDVAAGLACSSRTPGCAIG
ncbi:hypothetical protein C8D87_11371 [Lentzea atacamensis]|uniref:Glycosyltransferase family 2 protein n=1 Tax=Lentzea atacamensis TaxID=531938 RepID=A0ABX9DWH0_9PSEU|nr:hypothetical protein [Lentzea atacamensis]RAS59765.1 hypothetical protein C8D87_11371 [Lentzea atacamensis]